MISSERWPFGRVFTVERPQAPHYWDHKAFDTVEGLARLCGCTSCRWLRKALSQVYHEHKELRMSEQDIFKDRKSVV